MVIKIFEGRINLRRWNKKNKKWCRHQGNPLKKNAKNKNNEKCDEEKTSEDDMRKKERCECGVPDWPCFKDEKSEDEEKTWDEKLWNVKKGHGVNFWNELRLWGCVVFGVNVKTEMVWLTGVKEKDRKEMGRWLVWRLCAIGVRLVCDGVKKMCEMVWHGAWCLAWLWKKNDGVTWCGENLWCQFWVTGEGGLRP